MRRGGALLLAVGLLMAWPGTAGADHQDANLPWPELLPSMPVTTKVQPHGVVDEGCQDDEIGLDRFIGAVGAVICGGLMGVFGGLLPAVRAARVSPIAAMRGE